MLVSRHEQLRCRALPLFLPRRQAFCLLGKSLNAPVQIWGYAPKCRPLKRIKVRRPVYADASHFMERNFPKPSPVVWNLPQLDYAVYKKVKCGIAGMLADENQFCACPFPPGLQDAFVVQTRLLVHKGSNSVQAVDDYYGRLYVHQLVGNSLEKGFRLVQTGILKTCICRRARVIGLPLTLLLRSEGFFNPRIILEKLL